MARGAGSRLRRPPDTNARHGFWTAELTHFARRVVHAFWMRRASRILDEEKARSARLGDVRSLCVAVKASD